MNGPKLHWMKVSFVYDDGYLIQLHFAFRRSLRNSVPLHGKRNVSMASFSGEGSPWTSGHGAGRVRFGFSSSSPYKKYHHGCAYFSFLIKISLSCLALKLFHTQFLLWWYPNSWLTMQHHCRSLKYTAILPHVHKHIVIGCQFTFEITDGLSWTLLRWDHTSQNAFCFFVYMIEGIMYLIFVLHRVQWVQLCTQRISIWEHKSSALANK